MRRDRRPRRRDPLLSAMDKLKQEIRKRNRGPVADSTPLIRQDRDSR
jgi:hypothetical protein